jgi:hypothetical protein
MLTNTPECHFTVEVRGAFDGVEEISAVPMLFTLAHDARHCGWRDVLEQVLMLFTPAHDAHPLAHIAGPIVVRGAKPSDIVMIESWPLIGVPESPPPVKPLQRRGPQGRRKAKNASAGSRRVPRRSFMRRASAVAASCCVTLSCRNTRLVHRRAAAGVPQ